MRNKSAGFFFFFIAYLLLLSFRSIAGHENHTGKFPGSLYCASKFAVTALTESVRQELANEPNNKIRISVKYNIYLGKIFYTA